MLVQFKSDDEISANGFVAHYEAKNKSAAAMGAAVSFKACSGAGSHWALDYNKALMDQTQASCNNMCLSDDTCVGVTFGLLGKPHAGVCVLCTTTALQDMSAPSRQDWSWTPKMDNLEVATMGKAEPNKSC